MSETAEELSDQLNEESDRIDRIREQVPEEEFDLTTAQGIAHRWIAPYIDNGR